MPFCGSSEFHSRCRSPVSATSQKFPGYYYHRALPTAAICRCDVEPCRAVCQHGVLRGCVYRTCFQVLRTGGVDSRVRTCNYACRHSFPRRNALWMRERPLGGRKTRRVGKGGKPAEKETDRRDDAKEEKLTERCKERNKKEKTQRKYKLHTGCERIMYGCM